MFESPVKQSKFTYPSNDVSITVAREYQTTSS